MPGVEGPLCEGTAGRRGSCRPGELRGRVLGRRRGVHQGLRGLWDPDGRVHARQGRGADRATPSSWPAPRRCKLTSSDESRTRAGTRSCSGTTSSRHGARLSGRGLERVLVDAAAASAVTRPESFDVVVGEPLHGVLTDSSARYPGRHGACRSSTEHNGGGVPGCSSRCMGSRPTSRARASRARSARLGRVDDAGRPRGEADAAAAVMRAIEAHVLAAREVRTPTLEVTRVRAGSRRAPLRRCVSPAALNEPPGSRRISASPVWSAFGGHVIGSTARLRRGCGSPCGW